MLLPLPPFAALAKTLFQEPSRTEETRRETVRELEDLEPDFPIRTEDAVVLGYRAREVQFLTRYDRTREGDDAAILDARFVYGLAPRLQVLAGIPYGFGTAGRRAGAFASGDAVLEALYNLGPERNGRPSFAVGLGETFPTGLGEGYETAAKLVATRTLSSGDRLHANLETIFSSDVGEDERRTRLGATLGYDRVLDARTLALADLAYEQERERGGEGTVFELGLRRRTGPRSLLAAGVGFGLGGSAPRPRATLGFQLSF